MLPVGYLEIVWQYNLMLANFGEHRNAAWQDFTLPGENEPDKEKKACIIHGSRGRKILQINVHY